LKAFKLPKVIAELVSARNRVRDHYNEILGADGREAQLDFTLDGNLVGDIGEAIAVELFGLHLVNSKSHPGIDGYVGARSVQVKATGRGLGPAFRPVEIRADHLLFFDLDFASGTGVIYYNGPEDLIIQTLPTNWKGQRLASRKQIREIDATLGDEDRLPLHRPDLIL
jgi:hypothetical protein